MSTADSPDAWANLTVDETISLPRILLVHLARDPQVTQSGCALDDCADDCLTVDPQGVTCELCLARSGQRSSLASAVYRAARAVQLRQALPAVFRRSLVEHNGSLETVAKQLIALVDDPEAVVSSRHLTAAALEAATRQLEACQPLPEFLRMLLRETLQDEKDPLAHMVRQVIELSRTSQEEVL